MDERLYICLGMVSGCALGSVLGGVFGGLASALYAQSGGSAGTGFGRRVADAFARAEERELSPVRQAAISGAADGILFLGLLGVVVGALLGMSGRPAGELLLSAGVGSAVLVGGAAFFGVLAYSMARNGVWAVLYVFAGGLLGSFVAGILLGADNCLLGTIPGLLAGQTLSLVGGRYAPTFRSPHVGKAVPRRRSNTKTDITGPLHRHPGADAFRKPDPSKED